VDEWRASAGAPVGVREWPTSAEDLVRRQTELAATEVEPWSPPGRPLRIGGCVVCYTGAGDRGDPAWAAAAVTWRRRPRETALVRGSAGAPYEAGLLALREGALLEAAVRALPEPPDVLLVNATGRDHPRRAGLAFELGAVLELPSVGVTHRPLIAEGEWPPEEGGSAAPLSIGEEVVGCWLRTRRGARPVAVDPGWRTGLESAVAVVLEATRRHRTPEPLRRARRLARTARAAER
jgi:deoxyribonuclease V